MKTFKNSNLWKLSHWRVAKGQERICQALKCDNIMYLGLLKKSNVFDLVGKNQLWCYYPYDYYMQFTQPDPLFDKIIIIWNNKLYLLDNDAVNLTFVGVNFEKVEEVFNNNKGFAGRDKETGEIVYMDKPEDKASAVIGVVEDTADDVGFMKNKLAYIDIERCVYKNKPYTFFLIKWLKLQIFFKKLLINTSNVSKSQGWSLR